MIKFLRELSSLGWSIEQTAKKWKIRSPEGQLFTSSITPSCPHSHKQLQRDIRRYRKKLLPASVALTLEGPRIEPPAPGVRHGDVNRRGPKSGAGS